MDIFIGWKGRGHVGKSSVMICESMRNMQSMEVEPLDVENKSILHPFTHGTSISCYGTVPHVPRLLTYHDTDVLARTIFKGKEQKKEKNGFVFL